MSKWRPGSLLLTTAKPPAHGPLFDSLTLPSKSALPLFPKTRSPTAAGGQAVQEAGRDGKTRHSVPTAALGGQSTGGEAILLAERLWHSAPAVASMTPLARVQAPSDDIDWWNRLRTANHLRHSLQGV